MAYKSKTRRLSREKKFIMKELNIHVEDFISKAEPIISKVGMSSSSIKKFYEVSNQIETLIILKDNEWLKYVENIKKNPKYHVAPTDNEMFIAKSNFIITNFFLKSIIGMSSLRIRKYFNNYECKSDFINEIQRVLCEEYQQKEPKKYNVTEIQKRTYFSAILSMVNWFVSLLKRK